MQRNDTETDVKKKRRGIFKEVVDAFSTQYSWLGAQTSRELLLSAASHNLAKNTDPPYRVRMHVMLAWKRGWLKSTMLKKMADILGDEFCGMTGKVTGAAIRGSFSGGKFSPPKVSKKPIVVGTEFGQTDFTDELLNIFLALLEEGFTNINLNKIGGVSEKQKDAIEKKYEGVTFKENEFDLETNFVFWGGTYDPTKLEDSALKQRFKVVTPVKSLSNHGDEVIDQLISGGFYLDKGTIKELRKELKSDEVTETKFVPPESIRSKYNLEPRELGDLQRYMACRNWWGLKVNPEIMDDYIAHVKESRRIADMSKEERIMDLIFDNPMTYEEIIEETGMDKIDIYQIFQKIGAKRFPEGNEVKWVLQSGDKTVTKTGAVEDFLDE